MSQVDRTIADALARLAETYGPWAGELNEQFAKDEGLPAHLFFRAVRTIAWSVAPWKPLEFYEVADEWAAATDVETVRAYLMALAEGLRKGPRAA